jgi:hypothetical protein
MDSIPISSLPVRKTNSERRDTNKFIVPLETILFEERKIYSSPPSPESDIAWDELLPVSPPLFAAELLTLRLSAWKRLRLHKRRPRAWPRRAWRNDTLRRNLLGNAFPSDPLPGNAANKLLGSVESGICPRRLGKPTQEYCALSIAISDFALFQASLKHFAEAHMHNAHANHCFDYLRQSLQCGADMSLEWPKPGTKILDGWGAPHLCKSWVSLFEY